MGAAGKGEKKLIRIGGDNRYGDIALDEVRVQKAKQRYLAGPNALVDLKAVYNGEGMRSTPPVGRNLDYGKPSKDKSP